jgi:hypothetical protein
MTEAPNLRTHAAPPYRDYLTEGVTRLEALEICEKVAADTPEMAQRYLRWVVDEVRASGWGHGEGQVVHGEGLGVALGDVPCLDHRAAPMCAAAAVG